MWVECLLPGLPRREGLPQKLEVILVLLLHLPLPPLPHPVAQVALEAEAKGHHRITDTEIGEERRSI